MIDPATFSALPQLLSEPRMSRYLERYDGRADLAIRLYAWNSEITAAFLAGAARIDAVIGRNSVAVSTGACVV